MEGLNAPLPENTSFSVLIDLDNTGNSHVSAVQQTFPSVELQSISIKVTGSKRMCQASTLSNTKASSSYTKTIIVSVLESHIYLQKL